MSKSVNNDSPVALNTLRSSVISDFTFSLKVLLIFYDEHCWSVFDYVTFFLEKRSPLQTRHSIFQELEHLKILVVMKIIYRGLDNIHLERANFDQ